MKTVIKVFVCINKVKIEGRVIGEELLKHYRIRTKKEVNRFQFLKKVDTIAE